MASPQAGAYDIDSNESLLTILVFRGGPLAAAGHNHLVASHSLTGTIRVDPAQPLQTTFEIHLPVEQLTIDEPQLRQALNREDFPAEVPEEARTATRRNMLGESLLDSSHHPEIVLRSGKIFVGGHPGEVIATVLAEVRGEEHPFKTNLRYELSPDGLRITGQVALKQTDLGLTPYSTLMGALTVLDEMQLTFDLKAHPAQD